MRSRWAAAYAGCAGLLLHASLAVADGGEEPIRIEYHAPPACPGDAAFRAQVRSRTPRWRAAGAGEAARRFVVDVTSSGGAVHGRVDIVDSDGKSAVRELSGAGCDDVVTALAVVTAIAIDPHAATSPLPAPAPTTPTPAPAAPPRKEPPPSSPSAPPAAAPAPPGAWALAAGIQADVTGGVAPALAFGFRLYLDGGRVGPGLVEPSVRLLFERGASGAIVGASGTSHFTRTVGGLDACPLRVPFTRWLAAQPCATAHAGVLQASGSGLANPRSPSRPWLDVGLLGRLQVTVFERVLLEAEGGALFPLVRDRFHFDPATPVHQVPAVAGVASLGIGVRFL